MEWLGHELVPFEDVLCQMLDMLKPSDKSNGLRIEDFLLPDKIKIAGKCVSIVNSPWRLTPLTFVCPSLALSRRHRCLF